MKHNDLRAGQQQVDAANATSIKADNAKMREENRKLIEEIARLKAEIKMQGVLQEAVVKAAIATAEKAMEASSHQAFRDGMAYAQQFTASSRQMV